MKIVQKSELKGILVLFLIGLTIVGLYMASTGKLEWLGLTGPRALDKIIFISDRSGSNEIYSMNTDGSDQKKLTNNANVLSAPTISPIGNRIAYVGIIGRMSQVLAIGADGGKPTQLTSATGPKSQPSYSPDGKKLAYIAGGKIYVADADGNDPELVLPSEEQVHESMASATERSELPVYRKYVWISNGGMAAVAKDKSGNDMLVLSKATGEATTIIGMSKDKKGNDVLLFIPDKAMPVPDDRHVIISDIAAAASKPVIAVSIIIGKGSMVMLFNQDSGKLEPIVADKTAEFQSLSLSPDGSELVIACKYTEKKSKEGILKLDFQSNKMQPLIEGPYKTPIFSPQGDKVAAVWDGDSAKKNIAVIDTADGTSASLASDGNCFDAIWSPVSKK